MTSPPEKPNLHIPGARRQGISTAFATRPCPVCGTLYQSPILNDAGQVLVVTSVSPPGGGTYQELAILEADGTTKTVLAERLINGAADRAGIPNLDVINTSRIAVNANGDVAALVTSDSGVPQILKFPGNGSAPIVIWDSATSPIFNIDGVDINDAGQVAFVGTESGNPNPNRTTTTGVYVADVTSTTRAVTADGFTILGRPTINNNGDVAVAVYEQSGQPPQAGYIIQVSGAAAASPTFVGEFTTSGGSVGSLNLNDYGQVAYEFEHSIYIDGELILAPGDRVDGAAGEISTSFPHLSLDLRPQFGFNNLGQVALGLGLTPDNPPNSGLPYYTSAIVRVNPEGATPDNPLVPFTSTPDGQNEIALDIFNGLGVDAPIWVDPVVATGFTYTQGTGGENFSSLTIPTTLSLTQTIFDLMFDYTGGSFVGTIWTCPGFVPVF